MNGYVVVAAATFALACFSSSTTAAEPAVGKVLLETERLVSATGKGPFGYGQSVSLSGDRAAVVSDDRTITVFQRSGGSFQRVTEQALTNCGGEPNSIDIDGDLVVVGFPNDQRDNPAFVGRGAVCALEFNGIAWVQLPKLIPPDSHIRQGFGRSVAVRQGRLAAGTPSEQVQGSAYVFDRVGANWTLRAKLLDASAGSGFGGFVDLGAGIVVAGGSNAGGAHVYREVDGEFVHEQYLQPVTPGYLQSFFDANFISVAGDTVAISASNRTEIFERETGIWVRKANITSTSSVQGTAAGPSHVAVGGTDENNVGFVVVYGRTDNGWARIRKLIASDSFPRNGFGSALSFSDTTLLVAQDCQPLPCSDAKTFVYEDVPIPDGLLLGNSIRNAAGSSEDSAGEAIAFANGLLVVGAPNADDGGAASGEAYVFSFAPSASAASKRTSTAKSAQLIAVLRPPSGISGDKFGSSIAVSANGETIVVGAPGAVAGEGQAHVFARPVAGWQSTSVVEQSLSPPAPTIDVAFKGFGGAVALSDTGAIAVGAPASDRAGVVGAGAVATFVPDGSGYPSAPTQVIAPTAAQANAGFGDEVEITDGLLTVAAPNQDRPGPLPDAGAVHMFPSAPAADQFSLGPVLNSPEGGTVGDKFGRGIAVSRVSDNAPTVVVGATGIDTDADQDTGRGYVYEDPGTGYIPVAELRTSGRPFDRAGGAIEIVDANVLIGAPEADREGETNSGTVFFFKRPGNGWLQAAADEAKRQGKRGYAMVTVAPTTELPPTQVQENQFFGAALALGPAAAFVSAPSRDVQIGVGAINVNQGEIDVFVFDEVFSSGFE